MPDSSKLVGLGVQSEKGFFRLLWIVQSLEWGKLRIPGERSRSVLFRQPILSALGELLIFTFRQKTRSFLNKVLRNIVNIARSGV